MNSTEITPGTDTIPGYPAPEATVPVRRVRKHRGLKITAAVIGGFIGLIILVSVAAGGGSKATSAPAAATSAPAAATSAPAAATSAPATTAVPAAAAPSKAEQVMTWFAGDGGTNMQAVQTDVTTVATDASAEDLAAVKADGVTLSADAQAAANTPIPVDSADYRAAMLDFKASGDDMVAGDITGATTKVAEGTALINKVTTALDTVGATIG